MTDNRIPMSATEQKRVMLDILLKFADFCEVNNLTYWLDAGTLIGAVRHHGFIPWDDDIDVGMPRKDYDIFMDMLKQQGDRLSDHLFIERPENIMYPFPKLADDRTILIEHPKNKPEEVSVYIDIFPKDGIKKKGISSKLLCKTCEFFELLQWFNNYSIYAWRHSSSIIKRILASIGRLLVRNPNWGVSVQQRIIKAHNKKIEYKECEYVTTLVRGEYHKIAPRKCFDNQVSMAFEGHELKVPAGFDKYLRCLYKGDYMIIPPENQRKSHDTIIFWKDESAKESFENEK